MVAQPVPRKHGIEALSIHTYIDLTTCVALALLSQLLHAAVAPPALIQHLLHAVFLHPTQKPVGHVQATK